MAPPKKSNRSNAHDSKSRIVDKSVEYTSPPRAAKVSPIYKWHVQLGEAELGPDSAPRLTWTQGLAKTLKQAVIIANLFHSQSKSISPEYRASWFTDWRGTIRPSIAHKECLLEVYLLQDDAIKIKFYLRQPDLLDRLVLVRRFKKAWLARNSKNRLLFKYYNLRGSVVKLL
jgi:hypothetical protein